MKRIFLCIISAISLPICSYAAYTIKDGKLIGTHELATLSVQEHYSLAKEALETSNWIELIRQSRVLVKNFSETVFAQDSYFYLGMAYFNLNELDLANEYFSQYLKNQLTPKYFEESIRYKFSVAQAFEQGAKRRFLGKEGMPKWISGKREAIEIYDEVITALPQHDLAIQSLFGKANILFAEEDLKESLEVFQVLLRRFPKSSLARDSYVAITNVYKTLSEKEYADPDFLDLAEINIKKFRMDFPEDPKIAKAEEILHAMMEVYAKDLYNTAQFYERTKKPKASIIYYTKIMTKYPSTQTAVQSQQRLNVLLPKYGNKEEKLVIPQNTVPVIVDNSSVEPMEMQ
ncbi:MAG: tetratricopeptide repeat protein [Chlamydiota bacterium]